MAEIPFPDLVALLQKRTLLVLPVGLPGSGKTTLGMALVRTLGWSDVAIVSTDQLRVVVGGRRDWIHDEDLVFRLSELMAQARLKNGLPVYFDATNVDRERREGMLHSARRFGRPALAVRMELDPANCRLGREQEVTYDDSVWDKLVAVAARLDWESIGVQWAWRSTLTRALGPV